METVCHHTGGHGVDTNRFTEAAVKRLPAPAKGNRITYDPALRGFGARITAAGQRAFVLTYWTGQGGSGATRSALTEWSVTGARDEARRLKRAWIRAATRWLSSRTIGAPPPWPI